jgi:hypothetical protein
MYPIARLDQGRPREVVSSRDYLLKGRTGLVKVSFHTVDCEGSGWADSLGAEFFIRTDRCPAAGTTVEVLILGEGGESQARILGLVAKRNTTGFWVREVVDAAERKRLRERLRP